MQQLTGLDAAFLALDSPTAYGHVGSVSVLDPPAGGEALTLDRLTELIESRLHLVPLFRRRLVEVPFGLDQPYWIEDPDSTSSSMSASWRCPLRVMIGSWRCRPPGFMRVRWTANARCGRPTSSMACRVAGRPSTSRCTTRPLTACRATTCLPR